MTISLTPTFQVGDLVRVKAARRRDVHFHVTEVSPSLVVAINDRGGECRYEPASFELVSPELRVLPSASQSTSARPIREPDVTADLPRIADSTIIRVEPGEPIDYALKRFKKKVQLAGILVNLRHREFFEPRPRRRREKSECARRRRAT